MTTDVPLAADFTYVSVSVPVTACRALAVVQVSPHQPLPANLGQPVNMWVEEALLILKLTIIFRAFV